nr:hypothetical protein [candidate division Zixibacteria bacterium]
MLTKFTSRRPHIIIAALILIAMGTAISGVRADEIIPYRIEIESPPLANMGTAVLVPVLKTAGSEPMHGFDFLIGYDSGPLTLMNAHGGTIFNDSGGYQWEYFTYRQTDNSGCGTACPSALVRFVAVADLNNGPHHPIQLSIPDETVLFYFTVYINSNPDYACQVVPMRFYWMDCTDNAIAFGNDPGEIFLGVSDNVYDFDGSEISDSSAFLPTYSGVPDFCIDSLNSNSPQRVVDFVSGYIEIACDIGPEYIGDINLNGIQYEIADAVVFSNYFLYGLEAFTINVESQIAATDVNLDGIVLSVADYVYLLRIIDGSLLKGPLQTKITSSGILYLNYTGSSIIVQSDFEEDAGGIHLVFYAPELAVTGDFTITGASTIQYMDLSYGFDHDSLKILVVPPIPYNDSAYIPAGPADILEIVYNGETPDFISAQASNRQGELVTLTVEEIYAQEPTPFGIETGSLNNVPVGSLVSIPVTKTTGDEPMGGFDFLININSEALDSVSVTPGEVFDIPGNYEWEYFSYRFESEVSPGGTFPPGLLRVIAVADMANGEHTALEKIIPDGTVLFYLNLDLNESYLTGCEILPLRFLWKDCGDNAVAYYDGSDVILAVSDQVYDYGDINITDPDDDFPTCYGTPEECINPSVPSPPVRLIDFKNGAIFTACDSILDIGDLNLNGIGYEIADLVTFTNYLFYGLSAFTINQEGQIATSDVKSDGIPLTMEDFIYLQQVILGYATPYPYYPPMTFTSFNGLLCVENESDSSLTIKTAFEKAGGGLYLRFFTPELDSAQNIWIDNVPENLSAGFDLINDTLIILVAANWGEAPFADPPQIDPGLINLMQIYYTGSTPTLISAEAAGFYGEHVDLYISVLPNNPPVFDNYPTQLINDCQGGFEYTFTAQDPDDPPDPLTFSIVSGPGEIDAETGHWVFYPVCLDTGTTMILEVCVGDIANPCPQEDPNWHAVVELIINATPPLVGDIDASGAINILDATRLINYLYQGGAAPAPIPEVGDVDGSGLVNLLDVTYVINYLYKSGPKPYCP